MNNDPGLYLTGGNLSTVNQISLSQPQNSVSINQPGEHQMSHYAFASGIMNLGVMIPGMMSGFFSDMLGYERFFIYVLLAAIPSLLITYFIPFTYDDSVRKN